MLNLLNWDKKIRVNDIVFNNSKEAFEHFKNTDEYLKIELNFIEQEEVNKHTQPSCESKVKYEIQVKNYMIKAATPDFDFHTKWNDDKPMPMAIMQGEILDETKGMYRMKLHGTAKPSSHCMVCGKTLTNKVSLLYGIGPECCAKVGIAKVATEEEVKENYENMKKTAEQVIWEGWVIKKAIKEMVELETA